MTDRKRVYVRHSIDPGQRRDRGGLLNMFWRPLWAIFLVVLATATIGMLIQPSATILAMRAIVGQSVVLHAHRQQDNPT